MTLLINELSHDLIESLARSLGCDYGTSSMSSAIYDTAWLSMIVKNIDGTPHWLFPECFAYLMRSQQPDGGWEEYASRTDGVLNTMAALLALKRRFSMKQCQNTPVPHDIELHIARATSSLRQKLVSWSVDTSLNVGFEVLIPALLKMLEADGTYFYFADRDKLLSLNKKKLDKFDATHLYGDHEFTLMHSLEAFIGEIDFNRIRHHAVFNSMMASPSSTAAYLMNSSPWDSGAERYLREAILVTGGTGGVPSAFPSPIFEVAWTVSTLLESGFSSKELGEQALSQISNFLRTNLNGNGVVGFAPGLIGDADDTAKSILTLSLLGQFVDPGSMILKFESATHFLTYPNERDASFSANCNILACLLNLPTPNHYKSQITKAATFLSSQWDEGAVQDKWNLSVQYPMMLLASSYVRLLQLWDIGKLDDFEEDDFITERVLIVLTQIVTRLLDAQSSDGSWGCSSCEITSYSVLALKAALSVPWLQTVNSQVQDALTKGKSFLEQNTRSWRQGEYVWVEKVTYRSATLSQAYCLAALKDTSQHRWGEKVQNRLHVSTEKIDKYCYFFSRLPLFSKQDEWKIKVSLIESHFFHKKLERIKLNVFPRKNMAKDEYLSYIPFTWIGVNYIRGNALSGNMLWQMMVISMLNYQVDEYIETLTEEETGNDYKIAKAIVDQLCSESEEQSAASPSKGQQPFLSDEDTSSNLNTPDSSSSLQLTCSSSSFSSSTTEVKSVLSRFVLHFLNHQCAVQSSQVTQTHLRRSIRTFLHAHITQNIDNAILASQKNNNASPPDFISPLVSAGSSGRGSLRNQTYFEWVRTTSADHTSCPFSFLFFCCLMTAAGESVLKQKGEDPPSHLLLHGPARQRYLAQDLCRHLATMCRQYNDLGSISRDRAEVNLNSVDFPEFHSEDDRLTPMNARGSGVEEKAKEELYQIVQYERKCLQLTMGELEKEVGGRTMQKVRMFVDVTDLYGQIYVARDIASRMK